MELNDYKGRRTRRVDKLLSIGAIAVTCAVIAFLGTVAVFKTVDMSKLNKLSSISNLKKTSSSSDSESDSESDVSSANTEINQPAETVGAEGVAGDASVINFTLSRLGYAALNYFTDYKSQNINYKFLDGFVAVIEPGATMHLEVYDDGDSMINKFRYTVCSGDSTVACQHGVKYDPDPMMVTTINFQCTPFETFKIVVEEYNSEQVEIRSTSGDAICMYVRREIRSLSEADTTSLMDAMFTMWSVSEEEGQDLYGDDYHDANYLLKFHHFNAAWQESDHIHEGNGFLAQHIKMTNIFEKAIQAVDSSVCLPYWDFTIDSSEGNTAAYSYVMSPTLFGSMTTPGNMAWGFTSSDLIADAAIPDGRWAFVKADMNYDFEELKAGYGYMRAPWNLNPSPYISRFTSDYQIGVSLPTCSQHYQMLQTNDMMDFFVNIEDGPHATTHSLSGGIYGCDMMTPLLDAGYITDETSLKNICSKWVFYMKEFYRYNYITPYANCTVADDIQSSECGFECNPDDLDNLKLNLKNKVTNFVPASMQNNINDDGWTAWTDFICSGDGSNIFSGDHLESASPADPSFWVIHPTLERLLQARFMGGGFDDEQWATDAQTDYVCNKAECYNDVYGTRDYYDDCCFGHFENDQVLDFATGNKSNHVGMTNGELIRSTDPRLDTYSVPYIYDGFTWTHCSDDFVGLIDALYQYYTTTTDSPTPGPTENNSTLSPTESPTSDISSEPTALPTQPSSIPSTKPTRGPTPKPTHTPTKSPSGVDDYTSSEPTATEEPTVGEEFTGEPSHEPTGEPTVGEEETTAKPTHSPDYTHMPTHSPDYTHKPTHSPDYTHMPTHSPDYTHKPTRTPTS